jgi:hypothetical protein
MDWTAARFPCFAAFTSAKLPVSAASAAPATSGMLNTLAKNVALMLIVVLQPEAV